MRIEERTENVKYFISEDGNEFKCEKHCLRYEELANVNYYHKKLCDVSFYNRSVSKNINDVFILEYKKIFIHGEETEFIGFMLDNDTGDCMALTIEHGYIIFMICNDWNNKDFLYEGTLDLDIFKLDESSFKEYTDKYLFDRELKIE